MMNDQKKLYEIAIGLIPGVGHMLTRQLVSYCGSVEAVFKYPKGKLLKIPGVGPQVAASIVNQDILNEAEGHLKEANKNQAKILFYTDKEYPARLKHIPDAPALVYYMGNSDLNSEKIIGIVGTRKPSHYGVEYTEKLVSDLSDYKPLIVSGLAYGIDIAAHKAALNKGMATVGVMASGLDIIYPSVHKNYAYKMVENGGLLSEYPFHTKPDAHRFPSRNRIIAGICDAIIVVEAAEKGGALITAEIANDYNRDVFALPGNVGIKSSAGCNNLIKNQKAHLLNHVSDIVKLLNWDVEVKKNVLFEEDFTLTDDERTIIRLLADNEGLHIDEVCWKSDIPITKIASLLLTLEFKGKVKSLPGKKYQKI
jgi:DNA processing protein